MVIYMYSFQLSGRGGMERVISTVTRGLSDRGHTVKILLPKRSDDSSWERDLPVVHLDSLDDLTSCSRFPNIDPFVSQVLQLQLALKIFPSPDVLVCLGTWVTGIARLAVNVCRVVPRITTWLHFSPHVLTHREWLRFADDHICISQSIQSQINEIDPGKRTFLIYNPVDINVPIVPRPDYPRFLFIGRLYNRQKRIDLLFDALSSITTPWNLDIIGDGPDREMLASYAASKGMGTRVRWLGWLEEPWSAVKEATALILPSDYEGFPLVLIEALARGIPVIASDCLSGPNEIVQNRVNGWLFQPRNSNQLRDIIWKIVTGAETLPEAEVCRTSVSKFNLDKVLREFERALNAGSTVA